MNRTKRGPTVPFDLRAMALQGRQQVPMVGGVLPASPPGTPPPNGVGQAPRLPSAPVPPFDPQTPPLIPPIVPSQQGFGTDIETQRLTVPLPQPVHTVPGQQRTFSNEVTVYQTQTRWRGCDVFVDDEALSTGTGIPNHGVLVVRVYGYSNGSGWNLVSQGMMGFWGHSIFSRPTQQGRGVWVAAARTASEKFAVTIQYYDFTFPFPTGNLQVTIAAADEVVPVPYDIGAVYAAGPNGAEDVIDLGLQTPGGIQIPNIELLYVQAVNTSDAARYLLAFNFANGGVAAATIADMVWPLGPGAGYGFAGPVKFRFGAGFRVLGSSTAPGLTAAADCFIQALIR